MRPTPLLKHLGIMRHTHNKCVLCFTPGAEIDVNDDEPNNGCFLLWLTLGGKRSPLKYAAFRDATKPGELETIKIKYDSFKCAAELYVGPGILTLESFVETSKVINKNF